MRIAPQAALREGIITVASPSTTTVSFTLQMQSKITRRLAGNTSRTVQMAVTVSPMRTGALKLVVWLKKIAPARPAA